MTARPSGDDGHRDDDPVDPARADSAPEPVYDLPPGYGVPDRATSPEQPRDGRRGPWAARTGAGETSLTTRLGGRGDASGRPVDRPAPPAAPVPPTAVAAAPDDRGPRTPPPVPATPPTPVTVASAPAPGPGHPVGRRMRQPGGPVTEAPVLPATARPTGELAPLASDSLVRSRRHAAPLTGWRRVVQALTFGALRPGPSREQVRLAGRTAAVRVPIVGTHRVAVISLKGGVGKTTTTMMLGSTLASLRGDRVIALDANPDAGTLGDRLPRRTTATVRDLLTHYGEVRSWADLAAYTSQASSRLEVIANDVDPSVSTAVTAADYLRIVEMLGRYYSVVLTDSGTGLLHDAMNGILNAADTLVLVSSASVDGARSASTTLDWLEAQGYGHLVSSAVTVVSSVRPGGKEVDVDAIVDYFASRSRAVVRIPFDPHLETGAETDLEALRPATRDAYLDLAVAVAADFDRGDEAARARLRGRPRTG